MEVDLAAEKVIAATRENQKLLLKSRVLSINQNYMIFMKPKVNTTYIEKV
jgi:hypothetical protein